MDSSIDESKKTAPDMKRLLNEYGNSILRMCFLYLKDVQLAEDALQDTFLRVYHSYSDFKGFSNEKTWITRIAINVCKNYLRSWWWRFIDESIALEAIPAQDSLIGDDTLIVEIMKLSTKYKEVILLFYYQDMKIREISEVLQIPESTVAVRLKRAREALKIRLKGWFYDEQ